MAWRIKATTYEACSCAMFCPCNFGPAEPTQGWCSAGLVFAVSEGESDGVDLAGSKVALQAELPGDFLGGIDKARLYLDDALSESQRTELEAIFHGNKGGLWEGMKEAIAQWLPSKVASIQISDGDSTRITVGTEAEFSLEALKTEDGKRTKVVDAMLPTQMGQGPLDLSISSGSRWSDPELRAWEGGGYGAVSTAEWSG